MRKLFLELFKNCPYNSTWISAPTKTFTDSTAAISLNINPQVSKRNKHMEINVYHARGLVKNGTIWLKHLQISLQKIDSLTKEIPHSRFTWNPEETKYVSKCAWWWSLDGNLSKLDWKRILLYWLYAKVFVIIWFRQNLLSWSDMNIVQSLYRSCSRSCLKVYQSCV